MDAAINEGFSESLNPGYSAYRERGISPWLRGISNDRESRRTPRPEIRQRPFTQDDRVILLLEALLRVHRDLPEIRQATIGTLNSGWEGRVPLVDTIRFVDDEVNSDTANEVMASTEAPEDIERRERVVRALLDLRNEVRP